jgi:hypothetical protein
MSHSPYKAKAAQDSVAAIVSWLASDLPILP